MKNHKLRWALLCVAATPGLLLASPTHASQTVVIGRGDSIDSLARRYRVSITDIARANGIDKDATLRDGRRLVIPDPPHSISKPATMRRQAIVKGDRITVRLGPDESYRRLTMVDRGVELLATRKAGEWFQVELPSGRTGWIRNDFVSVGKADLKAAVKVAAHNVSPAKARLVARKANRDEYRSADRKHQLTIVKSHTMSKREQRAEASRKHRITLANARRHHNSDDDYNGDTPRVSRRRHRAASHATVRREHGSGSRYARSHHSRHGGRPEASAPYTDADVVRTAYAYRGVPYHYGGTSGNGFDCSGFTSYVYHKKGVNLPHSAADQFTHGKRVSSGQLKAGDLVFFHTTRRGISHVGIYAGEGKFVHASSGGGRVRVDSLNSGYYQKRLVGARRLKDE